MGIKIMNPGLLTTIQDLGRTGFQSSGVSVSGVMDKRAARIANILVGNDEGEAVLEATIIGPTIQITSDCVIAVTGADITPMINNIKINMYSAISVKKDDILSFGGLNYGSRVYISFAGGLNVPVVMGSKSTYMKAHIGGINGRKLERNDEIEFVSSAPTLPNLSKRFTKPDTYPSEITLRVILGPQDDYFTDDGINTFLSSTYTVTNEADRMGIRLDGEEIKHKQTADIISDGIAFGAIQIPSHGKPIIMMADRQTTGGYTKIGTVISVDLPLLAQLKPNDKIHFEKISVQDAQKLYVDELNELNALKGKINKLSTENIKTYRVIINGKEYVVDCEEIK